MERGWSPDTYRDRSRETLDEPRRDRRAFLARIVSGGSPVGVPGGPAVPLDIRTFWMWGGYFVGRIVLRTVAGTHDVHPRFAGHVGYSVVPWARRLGHATEALSRLLGIAAGIGMPHVSVGCGEDNLASRRVAEANGGMPSGTIPDPSFPGASAMVYSVPTVGPDRSRLRDAARRTTIWE